MINGMDSIKQQIVEDLKKYLSKERVKTRTLALSLSIEQMVNNIEILEIMYNENEDTDEFLTDMHLKDGIVYPYKFKNPKVEGTSFLKNIVSQPFLYEVFDRTKKIQINHGNRKALADKLKTIISAHAKGERPKGLYIKGERGIGKTFILKYATFMFASHGYKVGFINMPKLATFLAENKSQTNRQDFFERLQLCDVLIVDDIGGEFISFDVRDDFLFRILFERSEKNKLTFFTSVYSQQELVDIESKTQTRSWKNSAPKNETDKAKNLVNKIKILAREFDLVCDVFID